MPRNSFLPIAHVSKAFRIAWFLTKKKNHRFVNDDEYFTNPFEIGNLFGSPWNYVNSADGPVPELRIPLLNYYIECGWKGRWIELMRGCASRGDINGMSFLINKSSIIPKDNIDFCTIAGAAGHIDALKWLREKNHFSWDAVEVYKEASENLHTNVMDYIESNTDKDVVSCYGDGMPW